MKEIPEKKGLNLYRLSENCHFKLALESCVPATPIIIDSEIPALPAGRVEPEFNSGHGLAPNASLHRGGTLPKVGSVRAEARNGGKNDNNKVFP